VASVASHPFDVLHGEPQTERCHAGAGKTAGVAGTVISLEHTTAVGRAEKIQRSRNASVVAEADAAVGVLSEGKLISSVCLDGAWLDGVLFGAVHNHDFADTPWQPWHFGLVAHAHGANVDVTVAV